MRKKMYQSSIFIEYLNSETMFIVNLISKRSLTMYGSIRETTQIDFLEVEPLGIWCDNGKCTGQ